MKWFQYARRLSNVRRCGTLRTVHSQNVAEHSYYATILGMEIINRLSRRMRDSIDSKEVVTRIMFHDLEESLTGDIPYPFKKSSKELSENLSKVKNALVGEFYPDWLANKNLTAKGGDSGPIVVGADYLELFAYCLEEKWLGNRDHYITEIMKECQKIVERQSESELELESEVGNIVLGMMTEIETSFFEPEKSVNERMMIHE